MSPKTSFAQYSQLRFVCFLPYHHGQSISHVGLRQFLHKRKLHIWGIFHNYCNLIYANNPVYGLCDAKCRNRSYSVKFRLSCAWHLRITFPTPEKSPVASGQSQSHRSMRAPPCRACLGGPGQTRRIGASHLGRQWTQLRRILRRSASERSRPVWSRYK